MEKRESYVLGYDISGFVQRSTSVVVFVVEHPALDNITRLQDNDWVYDKSRPLGQINSE